MLRDSGVSLWFSAILGWRPSWQEIWLLAVADLPWQPPECGVLQVQACLQHYLFEAPTLFLTHHQLCSPPPPHGFPECPKLIGWVLY